jgi:hypothetical protein
MKQLAKLKTWMEWRGITGRDILAMGTAMGFLVAVTILFICGMIASF